LSLPDPAGSPPGRLSLVGTDEASPCDLRWSLVVSRDRNGVRVAPSGEIDLSSAHRLEQQVTRLLDEGPSRLVIDLADLEFIDLSGVRALLRCREHSAQLGIPFRLVSGSGEPRRILQLCGLLARFDCL
jgi:anti-sigma B factor antagonist